MSGRPFVARYGGRCAADCGEPIHEGDQVVYEDDELVHADCEDGQPEPAKPAEVCRKCFVTRPCFCEPAQS